MKARILWFPGVEPAPENDATLYPLYFHITWPAGSWGTFREDTSFPLILSTAAQGVSTSLAGHRRLLYASHPSRSSR